MSLSSVRPCDIASRFLVDSFNYARMHQIPYKPIGNILHPRRLTKSLNEPSALLHASSFRLVLGLYSDSRICSQGYRYLEFNSSDWSRKALRHIVRIVLLNLELNLADSCTARAQHMEIFHPVVSDTTYLACRNGSHVKSQPWVTGHALYAVC